jgi:FkbM family methyltransferase
LRALLERLSRGVVLRRRLPAQYGGHCMYVSPDASLRFWRRDLGRTDPWLLGLAGELASSGSNVWDIGANVGLFAMAAAGLAGSQGAVVAVEPDPFLVSLMRRSSAELPPTCAAVEVIHAAVADRGGTSSFSIAHRSRAASHLAAVTGSTQSGGVREVVEVATLTLDDLLATHTPPDLVKIDVEGAELLCLRGGTKLLSSVRPVLLCEVSAENSGPVTSLLQHYGYEMLDASVPAIERRPLPSAAWNTLARPATPGGPGKPWGTGGGGR